ncbi:MAG: hypothetical protein M3O22_00235 [Pseudomonadota bacterium]|nr:hypothetical protein [Pseudomonadota bacterium]
MSDAAEASRTIRSWWKKLETANRTIAKNPRDFRAMAMQGVALYWLNEAIFNLSVGGKEK